MVERDPLHVVSLVLTCVAGICQVLGSFLPNWWILMDNHHNILATYNLFGDIHCSEIECYPSGNATDRLPADSGNATWLNVIRILSIVGIALVFLALLIQLVFLKTTNKKVSIASIAALLLAALVSFVNGFLFISKYSVLSYVYATERHPNALIYNSGASALILISFILCIVASVCTTYGLRLRSKQQFA